MKHPRVEVRWQDHVFSSGEYDKVDDKRLAEQKSVGYLMKKTKKVLVIAQSRATFRSGRKAYNETLTIDMRTKPKVRKLTS
jgi:hypothetical protein